MAKFDVEVDVNSLKKIKEKIEKLNRCVTEDRRSVILVDDHLKTLLKTLVDFARLQMSALSATYAGRITDEEHNAMVELEDLIIAVNDKLR
jgi:hypothetical protein